MGKLAEYLKSEAEALRGEASERKLALQEWLESVGSLYALLAEWLREADGGMNLLIVHDEHQALVTEPRFGPYWTKKLTVDLASRRVFIEPKARFVIATIHPTGREARRADGMVEIKSGSIPEYYLFRWKTDSGDEWFIQSVPNWGRPDRYGEVEPLTRERFEAAVFYALT